MTSSTNPSNKETEAEQFGDSLEERNEIVGRTLIERAGIDIDAYEDLNLADIGRHVVSGGPMAHPAAEAYKDLDEKIAREEILPRIDDELISEHEEHPIGQHSDDLERVLTYLRRQPVDDKYALVETKKDEEWRIAKTTGIRGEPPEIVGEETFESQEEAEHALFLQRIEDLREKFE